MRVIGRLFKVDGKRLEEQYKNYFSGYRQWPFRERAERFVIFPENMGPRLSIDETSLSHDELYTIVTNKDAKGRKGCLVAMIKGTDAETVTGALRLIPHNKRSKVQEVTLDLSPAMKEIVRYSFPNAVQVSDRFHVQRLFVEALDDLRIRYRWEVLEEQNRAEKEARKQGIHYHEPVLENGDTKRQLLFRSKRLLMMHKSKWSETQLRRATELFRLYPDIQQVYNLYLKLVDIYNNKRSSKDALRLQLARWYNEVDSLDSPCFKTVLHTFQLHNETIVNYFDNRSTNAAAESFNAKIKAFRAQFRGVRDVPFFIFRLSKIFA